MNPGYRSWIVVMCGVVAIAGCGGSSTTRAGSGQDGGAGSGSGGVAGTAGTGAGGSGAQAGSGGGGASGAAGSGGSGGLDGGSKICGTIAGLTCGAGEWCDYPPSQPSGKNYCGGDDSGGYCRARPQGCTADCPGVCGCDGKFYCNTCMAHAAGTDDTNDTSCIHTGDAGAGAACTGDNDCVMGLKCCYPCGIPGCQNQCMQPGRNGQCPAFP